MIKPLISLAGAALTSLALATPADARMLCLKRTQVLAQLSKTHQEAPVAMGLAANGTVLEVLASQGRGQSWTVILTQPNGISCVLATGEGWQMVPPKPEKEVGS